MKILVCGTRMKGYDSIVRFKLRTVLSKETFEIIEGCCKGSADEYAEFWAKHYNIKLHHFPSTKSNYLKRNIEMVEKCDKVIAFWDGFSYGTAQAIASAVAYGKPVEVVMIK